MRNQSTKEQQIRGQKRDCRSVVRSREILLYKPEGQTGNTRPGEKKKKRKEKQRLYYKEMKVALRLFTKKSLPSVRMVINYRVI